jgi:hypothetical protein
MTLLMAAFCVLLLCAYFYSIAVDDESSRRISVILCFVFYSGVSLLHVSSFASLFVSLYDTYIYGIASSESPQIIISILESSSSTCSKHSVLLLDHYTQQRQQ